ncbi:MAG: SDR family NAD(P)-dependent oxidoreductase [Acidimicrobiales bacterium]
MTTAYPTGTRLEGKVGLISGGARGMGESHAGAMVAQGAQVLVADILDAEGEALANELRRRGHTYVHVDVSDREQWAGAVARILDLGSHNVRCTSVHPGGVATPMTADPLQLATAAPFPSTSPSARRTP